MPQVFQSTRPRGARRDYLDKGSQVYIVSIHAPARGATVVFSPVSILHIVSIHAPARGATSATCSSNAKITVSIHAPARGATWLASCVILRPEFQSTRPRGARPPKRGCRA